MEGSGPDDGTRELRPDLDPRVDASLGSTVDGIEELPGQSHRAHDVRLTEGALVGRYRLERRLGSGSMGVVFAAYDPELCRTVALKVLPPGASRHRIERMLREAQSQAQVDHPNVVTVHDVGNSRGDAFIAMEFVEGETLQQWLETERSYEQIIDVFLQAGDGLVAAHDAGLVHRDFKPSNVLVGRDGRVRVADFGLALDESDDSHASVKTKRTNDTTLEQPVARATVVGTLAYAAPEQLQLDVVDARADQFAFCVALFEALYEQPPFPRGPAGARLYAMLNGAPPSALRGPVPASVDACIKRGLRIDPERRYQTMGVLLRVLRGANRKRPPWRWLAASVVAVAGLGVAGYIAQRPECGQLERPPFTNGDRSAISVAFASTELDWAEDAAHRSTQSLSNYAAAFEESQHKVCADLEGAALDRAQQCLNERRARLATVIAVLADADAAAAMRAQDLVDSLPPPHDCENPVVADAADPWAAVTITPSIAAARNNHAVAEAELRAGRFDRCLGVLDEASELADALDLTAFRAEIAFTQGRCHLESGRRDTALKRLEDATSLAIEIEHADVVVDAASTLAEVHATDVGNLTEAERWVRTSRSWSVRARLTPRRRAAVAIADALVASARGGHESGIVALEVVLEALDPARDFAAYTAVATKLAKLQTLAGRGKEATATYERLLQRMGERYPKGHPRTGDVLAELSVTYRQLGEPQRSLEAARAATRALEGGQSRRALANALVSEGSALFELGRPAEGYAATRRAIDLLGDDSPGDPEMARALGNAGAHAFALQKFAEGTELIHRAILVEEEAFGPEGPRLAALYGNLGSAYRQMGKLEESERYLRKALELVEARSADVSHRVITMTSLAETIAARGDWEQACGYHQRALEQLERAEQPLPRVQAYPTLGLGVCARQQGDFANARARFEEVIELVDGTPGADEFRAEAQYHLATELRRDGEDAAALQAQACATLRERGLLPAPEFRRCKRR